MDAVDTARRSSMLVKEFFQSRKKESRLAAVKALVRFETAEVYQFMIKALKDRAEEIVVEAIKYLGDHHEMDTDGSVLTEHLIPLKRDKRSWVKIETTEALGKYGTKKADDALVRMLGDRDLFTRERAVDIIIQKKDPHFALQVLKYLARRFTRTRHESKDYADRWVMGRVPWEQDQKLIRYVLGCNDRKVKNRIEESTLRIFDEQNRQLVFEPGNENSFVLWIKYCLPARMLSAIATGENFNRDEWEIVSLIFDRIEYGGIYEKAVGILLLLHFAANLYILSLVDDSCIHFFEEKKVIFEKPFISTGPGYIVDINYDSLSACPFTNHIAISIRKADGSVVSPESCDFYQDILPEITRSYVAKVLEAKQFDFPEPLANLFSLQWRRLGN